MNLCCPNCHNALEKTDTFFSCKKCLREYERSNGYVDFIGQGEFPWHESDYDQMQHILKVANEEGWYKPIIELSKADPFLTDYIFDKGRAAWVFNCMKFENNETCVDLGSGWGNQAFTLSSYFNMVWSVEASESKMRFQEIRKRQGENNNIHLVRSMLLSLPFEDESVDLAVCNGVFEWLGLTDSKVKPDDQQIKFLKEVKRILKPTGCLYLGIENRFGAPYFLGETDHSSLCYTSLVPRKVADFMVRHFRKKSGELTTTDRSLIAWQDYRTYTYSYYGYKKILNSLGFPEVQINWVWPDYNTPRLSGSLDDDSIKYLINELPLYTNNRLARTLRYLCLALPNKLLKLLSKIFWPSFSIYVFKQPNKERIEEKVRTYLPTKPDLVRIATPRLSAVKQTFLLLNRGSVKKVVRVSSKTGDAIPVVAGNTIVGDYNISIEDAIVGRNISPYNMDHSIKAATWLVTFQEKNRGNLLTVKQMEEEINHILLFIESNIGDQNIYEITNYLLSNYLKAICQEQLYSTAEHGDFCYRNIFLREHSNIEVIDWDDFKLNGNPLYDVGTYSWLLTEGSPSKLSPMLRGHGKLGKSWLSFVNSYTQKTGLSKNAVLYSLAYSLSRCMIRDTVNIKINDSYKEIVSPLTVRGIATYLEILKEELPVVKDRC